MSTSSESAALERKELEFGTRWWLTSVGWGVSRSELEQVAPRE
ncbi:hypothetical protein [Natronobiforma cellulositropha]|nr:hypothetical protein [Natronobiforma cellulositropha]